VKAPNKFHPNNRTCQGRDGRRGPAVHFQTDETGQNEPGLELGGVVVPSQAWAELVSGVGARCGHTRANQLPSTTVGWRGAFDSEGYPDAESAAGKALTNGRRGGKLPIRNRACRSPDFTLSAASGLGGLFFKERTDSASSAPETREVSIERPERRRRRGRGRGRRCGRRAPWRR
jgi:hypothetical protein